MGKKGKGSRLARMTEEERARYMQHRAALEEEARRRKQQLLATFMRNKLRHEDAFTRLNAAKINQQWRALLRHAKAQELHTELRAARDAFQGTLARQDEAVRQLQADLRTAEEQYARSLQAHAVAVDTLVALHELRLEEQHERYRAAREQALARAEARAAGLREASERATMQLRVATFLGAEELEAFRRERTALHQEAADELRHTLMADLEGMVAGGDWAMERLWRQLRQTLRGYASATDDRRVQLAHLLERDADDAQAVRALDHRATQLEEQAEALRRRLRELTQGARGDTQRLQKERAQLAAAQNELRAGLLRAAAADRRRLEDLTTSSCAAIEELRRAEAKAARVLTLGSLCRRLETQREKVLPWGLPADDSGAETPPHKQPSVFLDIKGLAPLGALERFWRRFNGALLGVAGLRVQRGELSAEVHGLRRALRGCLAALGPASSTSIASSAASKEPGAVEGARAHTAAPAARRHLVALPPAAALAVVDAAASLGANRRRPATCIEAATSIAVRFPLNAPPPAS